MRIDGPELAGLDALPDDGLQAQPILPAGLPDRLPVACGKRPQLTQVHGEHIRMFDDDLNVAGDGPAQLLLGRTGTGCDGLQPLGVAGNDVAICGEQQILLGFDVMVQARFLQPHRVRDVLHGRGMVPLMAEQTESGLEHFVVPPAMRPHGTSSRARLPTDW